MVWFKVDDGWHSHPKVVGLSLSAAGLWAKAGSYCADHLTDGFVNVAAVKSLGGSPKLALELVRARLWLKSKGGWHFHEWLQQQPSRAEIEDDRRRNRERVQKWRDEHKKSSAVSNALRTPLVTPPPTRPDPTRPDLRSRSGIVEKNSNGGVSSATRARASSQPRPEPEPVRVQSASPAVPNFDTQIAERWKRWTGQALAPAAIASVREVTLDVALFDEAARDFANDCSARKKKPTLRWLLTQWSEWAAAGIASRKANANGKRAHAEALAAFERDSAVIVEVPTTLVGDILAAKGRK